MSNFGSYHPGVLFLYYMMVLLVCLINKNEPTRRS